MSFKERIANIIFGPPEQRAAQCYEMGIKQFGKGDLIGAEYHFKTAVRLQPESAKYLVAYGNALLANGNFEVAESQYSKAAVTSSNPILLSNWGVTLRILGRIDEAVEKHDAAVLAAPEDAETLVNAGATYGEAGDIDKARVMYEKALEIDPNNTDASANLETLNKD